MYQRFCENLTQSGILPLLQRGGGVLAASSGGADSTLLLHFFHRFCQENHLTLACAHVNHGIRGDEADRDEDHCLSTAKSLGIPIYVTHADVPRLARERSMGIEECARAVRYAWFDEVCEALGNQALPIATAHNSDDQLETVLHHLMRGTGLHGLTGIRPIRDNRYVRPLLPFTGEEIRRYCQAAGYPYVIDGTNGDTAYTRNYIRHQIVPHLEACQPNVREAVQRMTTLTAREDDYLTEEAHRLLTSAKTADNRYSRPILRSAHPVPLARALRQAYEEAVPGFSMTMEQTDILTDWVRRSTGASRTIHLPGGGMGEVRADTVAFYHPQAEEKTESPLPTYTIPKDALTPGCDLWYPWGRGEIRLTRKNLPEVPEKAKNIYKLFIQRPIRFDTIKSSLHIRTLNPGDTIRDGSMTRRLRKLYGAAHIDPAARHRAPIFTDAEEILFAAGLPNVADKVKAAEHTEELLFLEIYASKPGTTGY